MLSVLHHNLKVSIGINTGYGQMAEELLRHAYLKKYVIEYVMPLSLISSPAPAMTEEGHKERSFSSINHNNSSSSSRASTEANSSLSLVTETCSQLHSSAEIITLQLTQESKSEGNFSDQIHPSSLPNNIAKNSFYQTTTNGVKETMNHELESKGCKDLSTMASATSRTYQERAEALESLLELCAQLFEQKRMEELGGVLKPFGKDKASPRETAIWLLKSLRSIE
ncbi:serine/threonine-protein kinase Nek6-like [Aristolochia californica]|uniref:serine/threonine-protein kinase Nek6-like n=1 Tax=Aristolochia californica TaxID=171875 RepID=UPI0035DD6908